MLVRDVMTAPVVTVRPDAPLKAVARILADHDVSTLPVIDDHGRMVGVVSEADVVRDAVPPDPWARELHTGSHGEYPTRTADVMSLHPLSVTPDTELPVAADLLATATVKSLPVVDDGRVIGMISRHDIVTVLAHRDERVLRAVTDLLGDAADGCVVEVEDGVVTITGLASERDRRVARGLAATVPGAAGTLFR
jgi:CBS domain-containing protein